MTGNYVFETGSRSNEMGISYAGIIPSLITHDYTRSTHECIGTGSFAYNIVASGTRGPHDGFTMA